MKRTFKYGANIPLQHEWISGPTVEQIEQVNKNKIEPLTEELRTACKLLKQVLDSGSKYDIEAFLNKHKDLWDDTSDSR